MPVPLPLLVWPPVMVGFAEVPQQSPLSVTVDPPSEVIFPPLVAAAKVMFVIEVVVTVGTVGFSNVVKITSFP